MSSNHVFHVVAEESAVGVQKHLNLHASDGERNMIDLLNFLKGGMSGARGNLTVNAYVGGTKATGTLTFTGAPTATETFVIAGVTFTARASGATGNEFNIGGTVTATAANVAAAVNASSDVTDITATSALGVVTFTVDMPGTIGNMIDLSDSLTNATSSNFAGGANTQTVTFSV